MSKQGFGRGEGEVSAGNAALGFGCRILPWDGAGASGSFVYIVSFPALNGEGEALGRDERELVLSRGH